VILVAEYVEWRQPDVAVALGYWIRRAKALALPFAVWQAIMQEPSLPGKAGLLPDETA
jgi:hypothetical protein